MRNVQVKLIKPSQLKLEEQLLAFIAEDLGDDIDATLKSAQKLSGLPMELIRETFSIARQKGAPELFPRIAPALANVHVAILQRKKISDISKTEALRTIVSRALSYVRAVNGTKVTLLYLSDSEPAEYVVLGEGALLAAYRFLRYKNMAQDPPLKVEIVIPDTKWNHAKRLFEKSAIVCAAQNDVRDLVNTPPLELGPAALSKYAKSLANQFGFRVEVLGAKALRRKGYMGILSVGKGADEEPCLIVARVLPKKPSAKRIALVGKAVTFDSGGYCLKPPKDMWHMKGDMAGGAAVLGAMAALTQLKPSVEVNAYIPCAKNLVGAKSYLPGDVIRTKIGKSVHVTNTDAEGRLLLADALIRAGEDKADAIIDIATLTGSVVRALGSSVAGVMGTSPELVQAILRAGKEVGEDFWELPLVEEYAERLKSEIADLENVAKNPEAGAIIAGLFLREFVPCGAKWAHLDIAGPYFVEKTWRYYSPGATGFGVRTLVQVVMRAEEWL